MAAELDAVRNQALRPMGTVSRWCVQLGRRDTWLRPWAGLAASAVEDLRWCYQVQHLSSVRRHREPKDYGAHSLLVFHRA